MQKEELLLIFVKNPEPGRVKTRLAKTVGQEHALQIYEKLLAYTRKITRPLNVDKQVWYSRYLEDQDRWDTGGYSKKLQHGKGLGERMDRAFSEAFESGYKRVVIIGSDCAELTTGLIRESFDSLSEHDVVIGPSADGGYYLLGMKTCHSDLFEGITWSTPEVFTQTTGKIKQRGLTLHILPELNDVDDESDWNAVKEELRQL